MQTITYSTTRCLVSEVCLFRFFQYSIKTNVVEKYREAYCFPQNIVFWGKRNLDNVWPSNTFCTYNTVCSINGSLVENYIYDSNWNYILQFTSDIQFWLSSLSVSLRHKASKLSAKEKHSTVYSKWLPLLQCGNILFKTINRNKSNNLTHFGM